MVILTERFAYRVDVNLHQRNNAYFNVNVFGAVSTAIKGKVFYWFSNGIKAEKYREFLRKLKCEVREDITTKPVLFYDGLKSHGTATSLNLANALYTPFQNVAHSCDFNSIETLWSHAKRNLSTLLLLN